MKRDRGIYVYKEKKRPKERKRDRKNKVSLAYSRVDGCARFISVKHHEYRQVVLH